jgi:general secretion pathway protein F
MKCPRCGKEQPQSVDCAYCGIVIAKFRSREEGSVGVAAPAVAAAPPSEPRPEPRREAEAPPAPARSRAGARPAGAPRFQREEARFAVPETATLLRELRRLLLPAASVRRQFYGSLARLVASGVGLEEGLQTLQLTGRGTLRELATMGLAGLRRGQPLSFALDGNPGLVPPAQVGILAAGEQTGHFVEVMRQLESMEEESLALSRKLLSSLAYPAIVLVLSCLILPLPTLVVGSPAAYAWEVALRLGGLFGTVLLGWVGVRFLALHSHRLLRRLPGRIELALRPNRRALFFLVLRTSLRSGVSIREALVLAAGVFDSDGNKDAVARAVDGIDSGRTLTESLTPLVDANLVVLLATGERSGTLEESCTELFESYSLRAAARRRLVLVVASVLLIMGIFGYAASQILGAYQRTVEAPMQELEEMMDRETRGIFRGL